MKSRKRGMGKWKDKEGKKKEDGLEEKGVKGRKEWVKGRIRKVRGKE